jgi:hypothetical protein
MCAGWLSSWLQKKRYRFLGQHRFWVEQAKPPEDYIYENLYCSRVARYTRMVGQRCKAGHGSNRTTDMSIKMLEKGKDKKLETASCKHQLKAASLKA